MKILIYLMVAVLSFTACTSKKSIIDPKTETSMKPQKNEDGEWELMVIDSQYDYYLNAIAKPRSMYSESFLKSRNSLLVSEWNSLYYSGRYRNIIESSIEYNSREKYGFEFEYRLYQVFAYVSWKYGLKLTHLSMSDAR